jgi:Na+/melibiose symporter-like transporter
MGQALGGFVGGFALTFAGFSAARAAEGQAQQAGVSDSIQLMAGGLVGAFTIFSILVMAFYPLTEQKFREISAEIAARRAAATH